MREWFWHQPEWLRVCVDLLIGLIVAYLSAKIINKFVDGDIR